MRYWLALGVAAVLAAASASQAGEFPGTGYVDFHGYSRCVKLENEHCRVVLCHHSGGRVLEYSWKGVNAMVLNPKAAGQVYDLEKKRGGGADGGRCDIGPEQVIPRHLLLWAGPWTAEITGPRAARLTSMEDPATGVQLIRDFVLDARSSHLRFTQTIRNVSKEPKHWCHWSRTFAPGGGIVVIPLTPNNRFPSKYVMYGPGAAMNFRPVDENIVVRDDCLVVQGTPAQPKLGIDSHAGWLAYLMRNDLVFVKRFATYPDRMYNEMAAYTISIWYFKDTLCELEPIGPRTDIAPGKTDSFTEDWWLLPHAFPPDAAKLDLAKLKALVEHKAR
jgi:hypothetical protein